MPPYSGSCQIRAAGINTEDGLVHVDLKASDASFDWTQFTAPPPQAKEVLAIALAAITSNKSVTIQTKDTAPWSPIWWFDLVK